MINEILIRESKFETARKKIRENRNRTILFISSNDELNRKILEKEKVNVLLIPQTGRKDRLKQRASGFDRVMARLAKKNNVTIGFILDEIIESSELKKAKILARIRQNIKLCNKQSLKVKFIALNPKNKRNHYDLKALGKVLGMPTNMIKDL